MPHSFSSRAENISSPPSRLLDVTPDDGADLARASRALNVAGAGTVRVTTVTGDVATLTVAAGGVFPIRASRVWATGTTATGIVAMS